MKALAVAGVLLVAVTGCWLDNEPKSDFTLGEVRNRPGPTPYFVGEQFEELPLTAIDGKVGKLTFIYGDCDASGDGGCAPPLQVQIWPIERRPPGIIDRECRRVSVRGVPGAFYGADLDLYVGAHTVSIFADSQARALRAATALRPVDSGSATTADLPAPKVDAGPGMAECAA